MFKYNDRVQIKDNDFYMGVYGSILDKRFMNGTMEFLVRMCTPFGQPYDKWLREQHLTKIEEDTRIEGDIC